MIVAGRMGSNASFLDYRDFGAGDGDGAFVLGDGRGAADSVGSARPLYNGGAGRRVRGAVSLYLVELLHKRIDFGRGNR